MPQSSEPTIDEITLKELLSEAEIEVRHRLRRQPFPKPQFIRGVQAGVRWFMEAVDSRVVYVFEDPSSEEAGSSRAEGGTELDPLELPGEDKRRKDT